MGNSLTKTVKLGSLGAIALALALSFSGCAGNKKKDNLQDVQVPGGYVVSNELTFSDIPVPKGFKIDRKQSYAFKDGQSRIALLRYKGRGKIDEISIFYQNTMQSYQWEEVKLIDYDKNIQQFTKNNETCMVIIEKTGGLFSNVLITIQLTPHQGGSSGPSLDQGQYDEPAPSSGVSERYQRKQRYRRSSNLK